MAQTELSFEEKIDYIYKELKQQKRARILNFFFKLSILALLIFGIINIGKGLENKVIIDKVSNIIGEIIKPIVTDLTKNQELNDIVNQKVLDK
ncbi:hypothetical protein LRZ95_00015 [Candidatus Gracilibacteria bacterium]|nr:hypothetical protein [Candidatus Gracilibacteria bacterium]